jgi:molybdate transport system substrate-binding protein
MALVGKEHSKGAEGFYQFLQSDAAKAVFAKYGFGVN